MKGIFVWVMFSVCIGVATSACVPSVCVTCSNNRCYRCIKSYQLSIGTGAVVGIVIGCIVIGGVVVLSLLYLIVRCSETVDEKVEVTEATEAYFLPPSQQTMVTQNPSLSFQKQSHFGNQNFYPQVQYTPSPTHIKRTPIQQIHTLENNQIRINPWNCVVCLGAQTNILLVPCGHYFHINCLMAWFKKQKACPSCNSSKFQGVVKCNRCGNYNEAITLCPPGCQKPDHQQCFLQRNKDKMTCRGCAVGMTPQPYRIPYK